MMRVRVHLVTGQLAVWVVLALLVQTAAGVACERRTPIPFDDQSCVKAIQDGLIWAGEYQGLIDGNPGAGTIAAIQSFQNKNDRLSTGELSAGEFDALVATARNKKNEVGYQIAAVPESGLVLGLPLKLVPVRRQATWGPLWENRESSVVIGALHITDGRSLDEVMDKLRKVDPGRRIKYERRLDDWFVLQGEDKSGHSFYVKLQGTPSNLKGFSATVANSVKPRYWPIIIAMASAFSSNTLVAAVPSPETERRPPVVVPAAPPAAVPTASVPAHQTAPTDQAPNCDDPKYKPMC